MLEDKAPHGVLDSSVFRPEFIPAEAQAIIQRLQTLPPPPKWWTVGAPAARAAGFMPAAPRSPRARDISVPTSSGASITLHVIDAPTPRGVYLHMHGGGFVLGGADQQDPALQQLSHATGLTCVSVEYRLAPEHPYPAAWDDCESVAAWLIRNAKAEFGTDTLCIGGESAGASLAVSTIVRLRDRHGYGGFRAAVLTCGAYDSTLTPSQRLSDRYPVRMDDIVKNIEAYAPDVAVRLSPDLSPLYADLRELPPALLTVGTFDAFLDDSLLLYFRCLATGTDAQIAVYPGAGHAFTAFPSPLADRANARIEEFLNAALS
jgi:acetyl esterase